MPHRVSTDDPWPCRCREPEPVVRLSFALAALRRAWLTADPADRAVLADVAAVLRAWAVPNREAQQ
jgi:hypothetical protein